MSSRAAAKVVDVDDDLLAEIEVDLDRDIFEPALVVGEPIEGHLFISTHECPFCHAKMQTVGVGRPVYLCSWCEKERSRKIEMVCRHERLETLE